MASVNGEKAQPIAHVEGWPHSNHAGNVDAIDNNIHIEEALHEEADLDDAVVKKLIWKVDLRLIPALAALYALALVDRGNLPLARLAGMDKELGISLGDRYSILTMMFFIPYIIFEFPANLLMRKVGPAKWLGTIGFLWGVVTIGMGFCHTWGTLLVCRVIFGALEAGIFPGCIYLMSCWYKRYEVQKRFSGFYSLGLLSNGVAPLIAYGIQHMQGLSRFLGWRWIFIIEGLASCLVAVVALFVLIDFPDRAAKPSFFTRRPFLTNDEASLILARIARDRGDAIPEKLTLKRILFYMKDWKIWEFGVLIACNNLVVYSLAFFGPLILKGSLGYSLVKTYALLLPPSILGILWMFGMAWAGDRYHVRGPIIILNSCVSIIGMSMVAWLTAPTPRYIGLFIGVAVTQSNIPAIFSYQHNNTVGQMKRALATAILVSGGGIGGIISANVFRQQDAPRYLPGIITAVASQALTVALVAKNFYIFRRQNRKAESAEISLEGTEGFRYTY